MSRTLKNGFLVVTSGVVLLCFSGCSTDSFMHSFSSFHEESPDDQQFRKEYPELKALLRDNHFQKALEWVTGWEKYPGLSDANKQLLRKDKNTICMIGSAYYMGIAKERRKAGRFRGALEALKRARSFTPQDPTLRKDIERTEAQMIVSGQEGEDWGELLQKLLALKSRNPSGTTIDPTIGWAYGKLAESEYVSGRFGLALDHSRKALLYQNTNDLAARIRDRVSGMVRKLVGRAEAEYRGHRYPEAKVNLEKAMQIDPQDSQARKDWQILSETPGGGSSGDQATLK